MVILTADQNIILCDIKENDKEQIAAQLKSYGIKLREDVSKIYRNMLACVALPTCGKALAEAERVQLPLVADFEKILDKHGMSEENLSIRIAGCPNGCSRPYVGDIGIVGRMPDNYAMFIGGDFEGTRLSTKLLDRVPYENLVEVLDLLFSEYVLGKNTGEAFGNYANRVGVLFLAKILEEKLGDKYKWAKAV
jgi:sulfite reductase (ferredoxin)